MTTPHPAELTEAERVRLRELADELEAAEIADLRDYHSAEMRALLDALEAAERERDGQRARADRHNKVANAKHDENHRLREDIEALADEYEAAVKLWNSTKGERSFALGAAADLRALLSTSSVRGEGDG